MNVRRQPSVDEEMERSKAQLQATKEQQKLIKAADLAKGDVTEKVAQISAGRDIQQSGIRIIEEFIIFLYSACFYNYAKLWPK